MQFLLLFGENTTSCVPFVSLHLSPTHALVQADHCQFIGHEFFV